MSIKTPGDSDAVPAVPSSAPIVPPLTDWVEEYRALTAGEKSVETFSPGQLFDMGNALATAGNFPGKKDVYEKILTHPQATPDDQTRIHAYLADMQRRGGDAAGALAALEALPATADPVTRTEVLQAMSECRRLLGDKEGYITDKKAIVGICEESGDAIPASKKLFYNGGLIAALLEEEEMDPAVALYLVQYDHDRQALPQDGQAYHAHEYHALAGMFSERKEELPTALAHFQAQQSVEHDTKFRVVGALRYLAAAWKANPKNRDPETMKMVQFFALHEHEMLPAWMQALKTEYDLVKGIIVKIPAEAGFEG